MSRTFVAHTFIAAISCAVACRKAPSSTETAGSGSQDDLLRLSSECAEVLAKSFGVPSTGNTVKIPGHTVSMAVAIEQAETRGPKTAVGVRVSVALDGNAAPFLTAGTVGIDTSREAALTTAFEEWSAEYGTPIVEAMARRKPALQAAAFDVYTGPTGIRGSKPEHLGEIHTALFAVLTPELSQLVSSPTMHAMTLMLMRDKNGVIDGEFRVDGEVSEGLKQLALKVTWPEAPDTYMLKQFYVLVPSNGK